MVVWFLPVPAAPSSRNSTRHFLPGPALRLTRPSSSASSRTTFPSTMTGSPQGEDGRRQVRAENSSPVTTIRAISSTRVLSDDVTPGVPSLRGTWPYPHSPGRSPGYMVSPGPESVPDSWVRSSPVCFSEEGILPMKQIRNLCLVLKSGLHRSAFLEKGSCRRLPSKDSLRMNASVKKIGHQFKEHEFMPVVANVRKIPGGAMDRRGSRYLCPGNNQRRCPVRMLRASMEGGCPASSIISEVSRT